MFPARSVVALSLLSAITLANQTFAQSASQKKEELVEIVVTAQKREQSIQDVPITISALSGSTLDELGIDQFDELSDLIPGLVVQQQSVNNNGYVIRGITSDDGGAPIAPRVSVYLNGADVSRSRGSYFEVYDMERVEVVKGPQATLFGTAASIGAISFITAKPQEEFEAEITARAGEFDTQEVTGFVTGGNSLVQGRLAILSRERDGYTENNAGDDLNGYERFAIRPSVRITPNDNLTIDFVYNYEDADDPGTGFVAEELLFTDNAFISVLDSTNLGDNEVGVDRETNDFNATVKWDINDEWAFTYIGAYRDHDSVEVFDADGTPFEFLNFGETADGDQNSHEFRFNFSGDRLTGFFGLSYFDEQATQTVPIATEEGLFLSCVGAFAGAGIPGCASVTTSLATGGLVNQLPYEAFFSNSADNQATSVFADVSYQLTEKLEITAGIRYVDEQRESTYTSNLPVSVLVSAATQAATGLDEATLLALGIPLDLFGGAMFNTGGATIGGDTDDTVILPRINIRYDVNDNFSVYASWAEGERSEVLDFSEGRENLIPSEEITNFEIGIKGSLLDKRLSYSVATFYQDYENFQVTVLNDAGQRVPQNAGDASNVGLETDVTWQVDAHLTLLANFAYIDAEIDDDAQNGEFAGNQFRLQPETTGAISYIYRRPLSDALQFTSSGSWVYRDDVFFDIENEFEESAVSLVNLRFGIAALDENWSVELFANNLFDKEYIIDAGNTGDVFGYPTFVEGAPQILGIQATKRFF
ncbi:TonB-dependent receptor [Sessilibacter sp. MAH1]